MVTLTFFVTFPIGAQGVTDGFVSREFRGSGGVTLPYRLFVPDTTARVPLPVVVYLHGSGGVGTDNIKQISGGNSNGTHLWATGMMQARHPSFVLAPQLPGENEWAGKGSEVAPYAGLVLELLASLSREFLIDADRVYVVGQPLGGFGVWDLVSKRPELFAAAIPLCGGGDRTRISAARGIPIWAFHGARDETVPVDRSRELVGALRTVGSPIKYTEYPDMGHDVWTRAFSEAGLPDWLFSKKREPR